MYTQFGYKLAVALVLAVVLALASCSAPPPTSPITGTPTITTTTKPSITPSVKPTQTKPYGELKIGLGTLGNERFDPILANTTTIGNLLTPMFDFVMWLDKAALREQTSEKKSDLRPVVVDSWEVSADGLSWTYHIHKGIKFHNGEELTADDVKFSIEQYLRSDTYLTYVKNMVQRVEKVDDYTVRIYTQGKQPYLAYMMALTNTPASGIVLPKDYIEKNGMEYFERYPIGSGSFKYVRRVPGDMVEYEALDEHWYQTAAFKKLTVILMPEEVTRMASLKTGAVDITEVSIEGAADLDRGGYKTFVVDIQTPMAQFHGAYDSRAAGMPITDIRVRQALSLAINRDEIRQSFFSGKAGPPMPAYFNESSDDIDVPYWRDYVAKLYRYDPDEAKRLLKEAGYADGFTIKFYTFAARGASFLPKLGEVIQAYWSKVGVKAEIVPIDQGTYTTWRKGPSPQLVGQATLFRYGTSLTITCLSSGYESGQVNNMVGKGMPELDALINAARTETDTPKRQEILAKAIKMATDAYVSVQICSAPGMGAYGPAIDLDFPFPPVAPSIPPYANIARHAAK